MNPPRLRRVYDLFFPGRTAHSDRSGPESGQSVGSASPQSGRSPAPSLWRRLTGLEWPPRFVRNWRTAALLSAALLVVLGIALWICILVVTTVIGVRRGDIASSLRRALGRLGKKSGQA